MTNPQYQNEVGGYGQQPYPPEGGNYPMQPGFAGQAVRQEHPQSQTVFVLGIIGIFVTVCAWIGWYIGGRARKEIQAGAPYAWDGTNLKTGWILSKIFGILGIVGAVLTLVYMIVLIGFIGTMGTSGY